MNARDFNQIIRECFKAGLASRKRQSNISIQFTFLEVIFIENKRKKYSLGAHNIA